MSESDDPQKQEAARNVEFARIIARIVKRNVQPIIPEAIEGPHVIGDIEVYLTCISEYESEISVSYNRKQITFYNISPVGVRKTGLIDKDGTAKYFEDDPEEIRKLKIIGRKVASPPVVVPEEKALIAKLVRQPLDEKIYTDLRKYAMWES
jgi:hypothetical protein